MIEFAIDLSFSPFPVMIDPKNELDNPFDTLSHVYKPFYKRVQSTTTAAISAGANKAKTNNAAKEGFLNDNSFRFLP